jgi:G3E family GTPase
MVTDVDCLNFLMDLKIGEDLHSQDTAATPDNVRTVADLLIDQVEFADVIVLNKTELVSADELARIEGFLEQLNPYALKVRSEFGKVPLTKILETHCFDFERARTSRGWQLTLRDDGASEVEEYGVRSFVFRSRIPFHPERFFRGRNEDWTEVLRSEGYFWLASRIDKIGVWSQAGRVARLDVAGFWWASVPRDGWPQTPGFEEAAMKHWDSSAGDCRQELVFIGIDMDEAAIRKSLEACLLTRAEYEAGQFARQNLPDPFPKWDVQRAPTGSEPSTSA